LLKQQKQRDQMISSLTRQLGRVLPFADGALKEAAEDNADILRKTIGKLYVLTIDVAEFSCDYVKRNRFKRLAKSLISTQDQGRINELSGSLKEVVEDFARAVNIEMLKTSRTLEEKMLLDRLNPIQAGYKLDYGCMEGTRVSVLDDIVEWALRSCNGGISSQNTNPSNVYWLYGIPGIGKTAVAHSICAQLHKNGILGGTFFCKRDDPDLRDPKSVLPTLIFNLAEMWGPYRKLVADKLRKDPKLTRHSAEDELFSQLLESLQSHPSHPLVMVIDALDECGDNRGRNSIISSLFAASSRVNWLRIIVTSRQSSDIETCFKRFDGRYSVKDLAADANAQADILFFARSKLANVANEYDLPEDWPGQAKVEEIVERSGGLFIFVDTLARLLEGGLDPDQYLEQALSVGPGNALERLYNFYATAIHSQIGQSRREFKSAMGTIIAVGKYRPLSDKAVAQLSGLRINIITTLVNKLGSLLYRDATPNGGIRVRHLSVIDFLTGSNTSEDLKVDITQANRDTGIACLKVMIQELQFNLCRIDSSLIANQDIADLQSRVDQNMSEALQYSCLHWSDHLSHIPETNDGEVMAALDTFTKVPRLLYWMEALSVMGKVAVGDSVLRRIPVWLKCLQTSVEERIEDALKFILTFQEPIKISAPHTYISGLAFVPTDTDIWRQCSGSFRNLLVVEKGRKKSWPARPSILTGHTGEVLGIAYSPDGRRIISCSSDNTIRIWDAETGAAVGEPLEGHTSSVLGVAYSPDGLRITSGSDDGTIRIWNAETGATVGVPLEGHASLICDVSYSPDGRRIVSSSDDGTIRIWDAETGAAVGSPLEGHAGCVTSVAYSPDGHRIVSGSYDKTIRIWDAETGAAVRKPLQRHNNAIYSVAYSPDGHRIISGCYMTIYIWDAETGDPVGDSLEGHTDWICIVTYSPDGHRIISGSYDATIHIWDAQTGAPIGGPLEGHNDCVRSLAYSPDGCYIVSGSRDRTIRIWDAQTGAPVGESPEEHDSSICAVAYSPDGRRIVSSSRDRTIRIWNAETGSPVGNPLKGHTDWIGSVAYSPDGRRIISGSNDRTVCIWDAETGAPVVPPLEGHTGWIHSVAYSPDGRRIISGSDDKTIRIWDAETGAAIREPLEGHTRWISSVAFSPDGRRIISGSGDGTIRIWDAETGAAVGEPLEGHNRGISSVAYSPDSRRIISGSDDSTIRIWDVETGAPVRGPLEGHTLWIRSVSYSPDGCHIVSSSSDQTIRIWDAQTGAPIRGPLEGHVGSIYSVAYSPDGCNIISGSRDRTVRIWDLAK
ncbi:hypothetical protein FRC19_002623, partial [Serendipita sp. 401]